MAKLEGKVALVTGASRGIGRGIALELAKSGASVIINYSKDDVGAKETLDMVNEIGGYGKLLKGDISIYEECERITKEIIKIFGKIDILINNAGISKIGLFMDMSKEDIDSVIDCNLKGTIYLSNNIVKEMIKNSSGNIINISSIWGNVGASCEVVYSGSKGGVNMFTKALAKEIAPMGIRVNGIAPGVINTTMNSFLSVDETNELKEEIPMGRFGEVNEIGELAVFLCENQCNYLTGQIITVDGGLL